MKKIALILVLAMAIALGLGALSTSAIVHPDFVYYNDGTCFSVPKKPSAHQAHGWRPVTVVGNNADENGNGNGNVAFDEEGKLQYNANTNWSTPAVPQTTVNPGWWAAAAATYTDEVTANQIVIPVIGGTNANGDVEWGGAYNGDPTQHKIWIAEDVTGTWTEFTNFTAEAIEHTGDYVDSSWGYVAIFVYTFHESVTARNFLVTFGQDKCMLQMNHCYAAFNPKNVVETTAAPTEAPTTAAPTEAPETEAATTVAPVETDAETSGLPTGAIIGIVVAAVVVVAVVVVIIVKKRK